MMGALIAAPETFPLYSADGSDAIGIAKVDMALTGYVGRYLYWLNQSSGGTGISLCPFCPEISFNPAGDIANAYKKGIDWFPTLNPSWKNLIGATEANFELTGDCLCTYFSSGMSSYTVTHPGPDCSIYSGGLCFPQGVLTFYDKDSDGFILTESAMNGPGMNYDVQFMDGSNHMQMKNDSKMKDAVDAIFIHGLGKEYFKTEER